uniref:nucleus accumbens-associated protein 2-like n=1 Tax=Scatophagus argus TaxID=75038 RepID=UPI001ED85ED3|nr:nucleus accumbens-associated protein 2-like [Scatophagus argus]XP_046242419.1 nucleus accumbens-associated protein 2-like [Scatophagus argus]XP_046242420.1 nucleus accumbens-associated protein 2-like [Scatophagus argus]XP_046242421.1 nucleus accumbens-associated protein 2-like [Scatophagus argus]XP_046242422.1 nucleus accumbens-associated protein 2-like [Scatophagus argus]
MSEGLLQVEIPDFGSSVLGSLNEQRLLGHYCDVSILVQGQAFKAHRAVLAASSLYFRDLFSSAADSSSSSSSPSSQAVFELPSSVTPTCFQQILSFCYTGRLSMAASEQLVLMYTAGYLQIQNIVERGMELMMMKGSSSSSPLCCDSQTTSADELAGFEAPIVQQQQQQQQHSAPQLQEASPDQPSLSPEELLLAVSRIKQERADTPPAEENGGRVAAGEGGGGEEARVDVATDLQSSRSSTLCYLGAGGGLVPGLQSYLLAGGGRSSPGGSSLPTDSPPSHPPTEEELEEDYYGNTVHPGLYQHIYGHPGNPYIQDKMEMLSLPLANERRPCVLVGRDNMALPASLISQIGYRCHPSLYTEGDPGEKVELVAGSGVFMTRGQLMNCHLCAGVKHKVLLRRLLATFFDRNTLANSCGTGIRSSTNDPSRKPLDNRVLNTVKLYCQNFAPNFKESEMNVIAADMCTNARRVRKRWLPKIQSLLPDSLPTSSHPRKGKRGGGGLGAGSQAGEAAVQPSSSPFELDLRQLSASYLGLEAPLYAERREAAGEREKETSAALLPHLQFAASRGGGGGAQAEEVLTGGDADGAGRLQTEQPPDLPLSLSSNSSSSSSSSHPSPQPAEPAPPHMADTVERGAEPLEDSQ